MELAKPVSMARCASASAVRCHSCCHRANFSRDDSAAAAAARSSQAMANTSQRSKEESSKEIVKKKALNII